MSGFELEQSVLERLLEPISGESAPCGPNLEHDRTFLDLERASTVKEGSQFGESTPPDWRVAHELCMQLFERTRDLRVAVPLTRASVRRGGVAALPSALRLVHGMLDKFWDDVHPVPEDDEDPSRVNALAPLYLSSGLLDDLGSSTLFRVDNFGNLTARDIDLALGLATARQDERVLTSVQLTQMLAGLFAREPELASLPGRVVAEVDALSALLMGRPESLYQGLLDPLQAFVRKLQGNVRKARGVHDAGTQADADLADDAALKGGARGALSGVVTSRGEALRAIDLVCEYFERAEPTHPAPLFLRRAQRLVNHDFLQLMRELAPDALSGVAALMGVNPDDIADDRPAAAQA